MNSKPPRSNSLDFVAKSNKYVGQLAYIAFGSTAILSLAIHILELIPLHYTAPTVVLPAALLSVLYGRNNPEVGITALVGLLAGIVAVTIYDVSRVPFAVAGVWGDFIPNIGDWALDEPDQPAIIGYSWRYIGNGGGMGVVFSVLTSMVRLRLSLRVQGIAYGVLVFSGLVTTLLLSPKGEKMLFEITPITFTAGFLGHLIYGYVLGSLIETQRTFMGALRQTRETAITAGASEEREKQLLNL